MNEIVQETVSDIEEYLYNVSMVRPEKFLGIEYIEQSLENMEENIRSSTKYSFLDNEFYRDLPANL